MDSLEYRPYRPGDEAAILALYRVAFDREMSPERWRWRFLDHPAGPSHIHLAFAGGECVGQFAFSPMPLRDGDRAVRAYVALDGMVHPDHHRRGIFGRLENLVTAGMPRDVPYYGFPNPKSYDLFITRLGWAAAGRPSVYLRPLRRRGGAGRDGGAAAGERRSRALRALGLAGPLVGAAGRWWRRRAAVELVPIASFVELPAGVLDRRLAEGIAFDRTPEYLAWRYDRAPEPYRRYAVVDAGEAVGYLVTRPEHRFGLEVCWVVDLAVDVADRDRLTTAALAALGEHHAEGCDLVSTLLPRPGHGRALRRAGFFPVPARFLPHPFFFIVRRNDYPNPAVTHLAAWDLTWGLHDAV